MNLENIASVSSNPILIDIGITKRELISAMAMQGLLADSKYTSSPEEAAQTAIAYADALIAKLSEVVK